MESYDDATYLWGANVTLNAPVDGLVEATRLSWNGRTDARGRSPQLRRVLDVADQPATDLSVAGSKFRAYCFWAQAEDGAMNRAVATAVEGGHAPGPQRVRQLSPPAWIDLHDSRRRNSNCGTTRTETARGLAGFQWRDVNPSGEASMLWYEVATRDDDAERRFRVNASSTTTRTTVARPSRCATG